MIMKCTYWMIIYLVECLKMIVCLRGIIGINLTKGKNNYIMIGIGMGLSFVAAWCFPQQIDPIVILLLFITNVVIFGKVIYGFLAVFSVGIFDAVLSYAIIIIFQLDFDKMYVSELFSNVEEAVSLCLLVVIALCRQRVRKENDPYQFQDLLYMVIILIGIILCVNPLVTAGLRNWDSMKIRIWFLLGIILLELGILGLIFKMLNERSQREVYENELQWNQKFLDEQKQYYKMLLQKEEHTKKFRHDMNSRLRCIYEFLTQGQYDRVQQNLEELLGEIQGKEKIVHTGNEVADIVINDWIADKDVVFHWKGLIPGELVLKDSEICILFSNLVKNAEEAVRNLTQKDIWILVKVMNHNLVIIEENPKDPEQGIVQTKKHLQTSKRDEKNHGFGSRNIQEIIEKYHGDIQYEDKGNLFRVEIVLPDIKK